MLPFSQWTLAEGFWLAYIRLVMFDLVHYLTEITKYVHLTVYSTSGITKLVYLNICSLRTVKFRLVIHLVEIVLLAKMWFDEQCSRHSLVLFQRYSVL